MPIEGCERRGRRRRGDESSPPRGGGRKAVRSHVCPSAEATFVLHDVVGPVLPRRRSARLGSARAASSRGTADNANERLGRETVLLFFAFWKSAKNLRLDGQSFGRSGRLLRLSPVNDTWDECVVWDDAAYFVIRCLEIKLYTSQHTSDGSKCSDKHWLLV